MTESASRILLIDDDESLRRVLEMQLDEAGFDVSTSGSAEKEGEAVLVLRVPDTGIDMEEVERRLLVTALEQSSGNRSLAVCFLGPGRHALRYRLKKYGLANEDVGEDPDV